VVVVVVGRACNHFDVENGEGGTRTNEIFITLTHPTPPTLIYIKFPARMQLKSQLVLTRLFYIVIIIISFFCCC
jgi:hypothetical protein